MPIKALTRRDMMAASSALVALDATLNVAKASALISTGSYDVAVVGAGVFGAWTAERLRASGDAWFGSGLRRGWADFNGGSLYYGSPDLEAHGFKHGPEVGRYAAQLLLGTLAKPEPRFNLANKSLVQARSVH
jgi:hypothetical protein